MLEALVKVVLPETSKVEYNVAAPVANKVLDALKEPSNQAMPSNSDWYFNEQTVVRQGGDVPARRVRAHSGSGSDG